MQTITTKIQSSFNSTQNVQAMSKVNANSTPINPTGNSKTTTRF